MEIKIYPFSINTVFKHCMSDLLPANYDCKVQFIEARMNRARNKRDVEVPVNSSLTCERVSPVKKKKVIEKFENSESFLGRLIGNFLGHFTDEKAIQGVRSIFECVIILHDGSDARSDGIELL